MNNQVQTLVLKQTNNMLTNMLEKEAAALPKGFNSLRFKQNALTVLNDLDLSRMKGQEFNLAKCLIKGAYLNVDYMNKECYIITYSGKPEFMMDYKGLIKVCKQHSVNPIKDIYAKLVREEDFFEELIEEGKQFVNFKPIPFNNNPIIGAFAVVYYQDGSMNYETMSLQEIEFIRDNFSKQKNGQAWNKSFGEMAKKTVLKRLCKQISLTFDTIEEQKAWKDENEVNFEEEKKPAETKSPIERELEEAGELENTQNACVDTSYEVVEDEQQ